MCADQAKCVDIRFCCEANHFPHCAEGSEKKTATLQVRLRVLWCVGGVKVCGRDGGVWEGWRCVGGVEMCGRDGGVWKGWSVVRGVRCVVGGVRCVVGGVSCVVGGVKVCGRDVGVWEGVRCVGGSGRVWEG